MTASVLLRISLKSTDARLSGTCRSVEDAVRKNTGDEIAGATGTDVTLRAERKLGGSAEALAPQTLRRNASSVENRAVDLAGC